MAGLDEMQLDVLHDFVNGAKKHRQKVMTNNGHRQTIFPDTILREMGLRLPENLEEMKAIPGINKDMVDRYGSGFMLLVNNTRDMYGATGMAPPAQGNRQPQHRPAVQELSDDDYEDDDDDEEVYDPNRQQVIDLCESDEDVAAPEEDLESNYSYGDSDDDDDDDDERRSHFFAQGPDPEVEAFNSRLTQTITANAATSAAKAARRAPRACSSGPKKRFSRKSGGSYGRGGFSGVKKRATSKATSSKAPAAPKRAAGGSSRGGGAGASSRAGGGTSNNGWSSIMGMPT